MRSRAASLALCAAIAVLALVLWSLFRSRAGASAPETRVELAVSAAVVVPPESEAPAPLIETGSLARSPASAADPGGGAPSERTGLRGTVVDDARRRARGRDGRGPEESWIVGSVGRSITVTRRRSTRTPRTGTWTVSIPDPGDEWRRGSDVLAPGSYRLDAQSEGCAPFSEDVVIERAVDVRRTVLLRRLDPSADAGAAQPR